MNELQFLKARKRRKRTQIVAFTCSGASDFVHSPKYNDRMKAPCDFEILRSGEISKNKKRQLGQVIVVGIVGSRLFSPAQIDALCSLFLTLKAKFGIDAKNWVALSEIDSSCQIEPFDRDWLHDRLSSL